MSDKGGAGVIMAREVVGTMLLAWQMEAWLAYTLGPVVGGVLAAFTHKRLTGESNSPSTENS